MVRIDRAGHVLRILLDRPQAGNALDLEMSSELLAAWRRLRDEDDLWVALLTATGDRFCVGADLKRLPRQLAERRGRGLGMPETVFSDLSLDKPVVCAINGDALGGGLELALMCDIRVAARGAQLGAVEARWGVMPAGGATQRLPRLLGLGPAAHLLLLAEPVDADSALKLGLIHQVVERDDLEGTAAALVGRLLRNGPLALRAIKRALMASQELPLSAGLEVESREAVALLGSGDAAEGMNAFAERRAPAWTGS